MFGTLAFSTASTIFSPSAASMASGFSHRMALPAAAAAWAISACRLFGTQMSTASMSGRATSLFQSVSVWAYPHWSANAFTLPASRAHTACSTTSYSDGKN